MKGFGVPDSTTREALDKYAVNASPQDHQADLRASRWAAREAVQKLSHRQNVRKCGRVRVAPTVDLRMADGRASFGGLVTCGAVWLCPPCQAKIAYHRALEVAAITEW